MKTAINLLKTPNQAVSANITDAAGNLRIVEIALRTMPDGTLIANLEIDGEPVFYGRRCVNRMPLMLAGPVGGNFYFVDQYENTDPVYTGLGDQYMLIYDDEYILD